MNFEILILSFEIFLTIKYFIRLNVKEIIIYLKYQLIKRTRKL